VTLELVDHTDNDIFEFGHLLENAECLLQRDCFGDQLSGLQTTSLDLAQHGGVAERFNRQRAGELDLPENDLIDRQCYLATILLRRKSDLDVTAALAQAEDGIPTGGVDSIVFAISRN
jgi:hypothetical protein